MHTQIYIHIHSQSQGRTAHQSTWFNCILKCLCVCVCSFKLILPKTNQIYSHLNNCREAARRRKLLSKYHINLCSTHFIFSSSHNHSKSIILKLFRSRSIFRGISSLECVCKGGIHSSYPNLVRWFVIGETTALLYLRFVELREWEFSMQMKNGDAEEEGRHPMFGCEFCWGFFISQMLKFFNKLEVF